MKVSKAVRSVVSWRAVLGLLVCLTGAVACVWQIAEACTSSRILTVYLQGNGSVHVQGAGVNGDATNAIPNPDSFACTNNSTVTLTATPDTGYRFDRWEMAVTGSTNPAHVTMDVNKSVRAVFIPATNYQLSISVVGNGSVALSPEYYGNLYPSGTVVTMTAMPATNWYFDHWEGSKTGSTNPATITMNGEKSVTAVFRQHEYTLTTSCASEQGSVTPAGTNTYTEGTNVTVAANPLPNYRFVSWAGDLSCSTNPASVIMNAKKTVTANFIGRVQLNVTVQGPGTVTPSSGPYDLGANLSMVAAPSAGARFVGWSGDLTGTTSPESLVMIGNKSVTARFSQQYTLTMAVEGEGTVSPEVGVHTYDCGTRVPLTATPAPGWRFHRWQGIPITSTSVTMDSNKTVTAVFVRQFTLTTSASSGGTVSPGPGATRYDEGTQVSVTATPEPPFIFSGWQGDLTGSTNPEWITMSADRNVTAVFALPMRTLTVTRQGQGTVTPAPDGAGGNAPAIPTWTESYPLGTSVTLTPVASQGWQFKAWNGQLQQPGQNEVKTVILNENLTQTATFTQDLYLTVRRGTGEGDVTGEGWKLRNTYASVTARPHANNSFSGWTGPVENPNLPETRVYMDANKSVVADFQPARTLSVALSPGVGAIRFSPGGDSKPSGEFSVGEAAVDTFPVGRSVTVTVIPVEGYGLDYWTGDLSGQGNPATVVMDADKTAVGVMVLSHYDLTMHVQPEGAGTTNPPEGNSPQPVDSTVTATASPASGYRFAHWSGGSTSTSPTTSVVMSCDRTLTANFAAEGEVILTADCEGEGSVSPSYASFAPGQLATVTATPAEGWHFGHWRGDPIDRSREREEIFPMWTDYNVHAVFLPDRTNEYHLDVQNPGGGTTTPASGWHTQGAVVEVQASPNTGLRFSGWAGDGVTQANGTRRVVMDGDKVVKADFCDEDTYRLSLHAEGPGHLEASPGGPNYPPGTEVTITAIPNTGSVFEAWRGEFNCAEDLLCRLNRVITIIMDGDKDVTGIFGEVGDQTAPNDDLLDPKEDACANRGLPTPDTDPILPATGTAYLEVEDLRIKGRGFDFVWKRTYRSRGGADSPMGYNWDFSYNARLSRPTNATTGESLVVAAGDGRREQFVLGGSLNTWTKSGQTREVTRAQDYSYTLNHPDGTTWTFNRFGGPAPGRLRSIVDRNGNCMTFNYDANEHLATVIDTLGRTITIQTDSEGHVIGVSDATGQRLAYGYRKAAEDQPADLELASICENAGPGRVTAYSYTSGFSDDRLNHNLLTIITPKGETYVTNVYGDTTDPGNINFDRVVRQTWGDGDIKFVYVPQAPSAENHNAAVKVIVNNGVGVVREYSYNNKFQLVWYRAFTGFADPDAPTTETTNRPTGKLRATDPDFQEEVFAYNPNGFLSSRQMLGGGMATQGAHSEYAYLGDTEPSTPLRASGNLISVRKGNNAATSVPVLQYGYSAGAGLRGCEGCGSYAASQTDAEGKVTQYAYDVKGNRTQIAQSGGALENYEYNEYGQVTAHILPDNAGRRRRDEYIYYASGPATGYLQAITVDAGGKHLTAQFAYDARGNITSVTDPKGGTTDFAYNAFDEVSQVSSRALTGGVRYHKTFQYDANGNLIAVAVEDVGALIATGDGWLVTQYEYNALNQPTAVVQEVSETAEARTEFVYDENRRLARILTPEAVAGRQPNNYREIIYDEFDRIFNTVEGGLSDDRVYTQFDYNDDNQIARRTVDLTHSPRVYNYVYDDNGRLQTTVDPLGNTLETRFSTGGQLESASVFEDYGSVLLSRVDYYYDAAGRPSRISRQHFDPLTHSAVGDGTSDTEYEYNGDSTLSAIINDRGFATQYAYDTVTRLSAVVDALGNRVDYTYDANSNVTQLKWTDKPDPSVGGAVKYATSSYQYDALDRLTVATNTNGVYETSGNFLNYKYDSRDNLTAVLTNAVPGVLWNGYSHDGLGRLIQRWVLLEPLPPSTSLRYVRSEYDYDLNSRVTVARDANTQETKYSYDDLDRLTGIEYADGTQESFVYNPQDRSVIATDAAGTTVTSVYDILGRLESRAFSAGPGVSGDTTWQSFQYDGLSRMTSATDDDSAVSFAYDSLSNPVRETLNGRTLTRAFDGQGNDVGTAYPGGTTFSRTFDALDRLSTVMRSDIAQPLAEYKYLGPDNVLRRDSANDTRMDINHSSLSRQLSYTRRSDSSILSDLLLQFDAGGNKMVERDDSPAGTDYSFGYDRLGRMASFTSTSSGSGTHAAGYTYDDANNRLTAAGDYSPGAYFRDASPSGANDASVHQYTSTPMDSRTYDPTGALATKTASDGSLGAAYTYDALGQLVEYQGSGGTLLLSDNFDDGNYDGWTDVEADCSVVNGALRIGQVLNGEPTVYRDFTQADADVSVSYRLDNDYSTMEVIPRDYYNSDVDRGALRLVANSSRMYLDERYGWQWTPLVPGVSIPSTPGETYRLRIQCEGSRVRVWRNGAGEGTQLLFDATTSVLTTTKLSLTCPWGTTYFDDVRVLGLPIQETSVAFAYDALGRRIGKSVENTSGNDYGVRYTYDGWRLAEWGAPDGTVLADYAYGNGLDELLHARWYGFNLDYYYLQDDQGSVIALADASGSVVERYGYGPGGDPIAYNAQGQPQPGGFSSPQLFAGREYDLETGLYYSRLRYYDPHAGRFITRDPLGAWADPTAWGNPYAHCGNSPWDMLDPFGLMVIDPLNDNQAWRNQFSSGATVRVGDLPSLVPVATRFSHSVNGFYNDPCESAGTKILDGLQEAGDWIGMAFPGIGDGIDVVNGIGSAARGNYEDAAWRLGAAAPFVGIAATAGRMASKGGHAAEALADPLRRYGAASVPGALALTGDVHHAISKKVWEALEEHPNLNGIYKSRDRRFETKAIDKAAHNGYGKPFRELDAEVISWIEEHGDATQEVFEQYLRELYQRPELLARFPNGL